MKKPKEIEYKSAEIEWCWDMFDRIIEFADNEVLTKDYIIQQMRYYAVLGLKGRQDNRED
jgi:hypothetical protein